MAKKSKFDGRLLPDVLKTLPGNQVVKIGAINSGYYKGSGYFLAGEVSLLLDRLNIADSDLRLNFKHLYDNAVIRMREEIDKIPTYAEWITEQWFASGHNPDTFGAMDLSTERYYAEITTRVERVKTQRKMLTVKQRADVASEHKKSLDAYVSLTERRVISVEHDPKHDFDAMRIIVEGNEVGTLWHLGEMKPNQYLYVEMVSPLGKNEKRDVKKGGKK